jgi:hypothetical protein
MKLPRGDIAAAESAFIRAIEIARTQHTQTFELRAAQSLAQLRGTTAQNLASEFLAPAFVGFNTGGDVPEIEEGQRRLAGASGESTGLQ